MSTYPSWSEAENALALRYTPRKAVPFIPGRTEAAIRAQRSKLQNPKPKSPTPGKRFTALEDKRLRALYPTADRTEDLLPQFPGRDADQLRGRARYLKLRRKFLGSADARFRGHRELIDQIRIRAKEDGIPLTKLGKACGVGRRYFRLNGRSRRVGLNFAVLIKAVEYFGGRFVIDWDDR